MRLLILLFHVERSVLSARKYQQDVYIAWRYSRNPACLGNCFRVNLYQLLSGFGGKGLDGIIIELSFYFDAFQTRQFVGDDSFASDVPFILDKNFGCFNDLFFPLGDLIQFPAEGIDMFSHVLDGDLRTVYQIY